MRHTRSNVKFETLSSEEIKFGKNNFIEIARKKAIDENGEEREFISISRGYVTNDGAKKYKSNIALPLDEEFMNKFKEVIASL
ncbi:MAG: hypothetical protein GXN99_00975 [Candidatus Nanohaloarchaeota archaeon]|nr:hypothetical protein [Candidatus Nanohaloarchaeota archaeon]